MRTPRARTAVAVAVACAALAGVARADTSATTQATAEALFKEGQRLMKAGQYAQACPKFADSQQLDPGVGTLLNLADCYEKNGQTASAWATYRDAAAAAREQQQAKREQLARQRADQLEPLLARLTIGVAPADAMDGLEIKRDGVVVPRAGWGLAVPVDPGEHTIDASAPKKKPWSRKVQVAAKEQSAVTVPPLEPEPEPPPPIASSAAPAPPPPPTASASPPPAMTVVHVYERPPENVGGAQRTWGVVIGVTGLVAFGGSLVLGELAKKESDKSNENNLCVNDICTAQGQQHRDDAKKIATVATIAGIGGAAFVVGGVVLYLTAPSAKPGAPKTGWMITPTVGGAQLRGSF